VKQQSFISLEERLVDLKSRIGDQGLVIQEILTILAKQGKLLMILLLTFPFCQPIQIPGFSTPFGLTIAFIALCIGMQRPVWLPRSISNYRVSQKILVKIIDVATLCLQKIRKWIHPRIQWVLCYKAVNTASMVVVSLLGLCLALPLPIPFSNLIAAWGIFFIVLGSLEKDGLFILVGYAIFIITLVFLGGIAITAVRLFS
jgi:hypothetical protein